MKIMSDPEYRRKIIGKIKAIEDATGDLTVNEISAVVCAAITRVLIDKGLHLSEIKEFYAKSAENAIDKADIAFLIYKEAFDDKN